MTPTTSSPWQLRFVHSVYRGHCCHGSLDQVQTADQFVRATTGGKLQVIVDQIRFLQEQVCNSSSELCG